MYDSHMQWEFLYILISNASHREQNIENRLENVYKCWFKCYK